MSTRGLGGAVARKLQLVLAVFAVLKQQQQTSVVTGVQSECTGKTDGFQCSAALQAFRHAIHEKKAPEESTWCIQAVVCEC